MMLGRDSVELSWKAWEGNKRGLFYSTVPDIRPKDVQKNLTRIVSQGAYIFVLCSFDLGSSSSTKFGCIAPPSPKRGNFKQLLVQKMSIHFPQDFYARNKISFTSHPCKPFCRYTILYNDVNNQQDATTFSFFNLFNSAPHIVSPETCRVKPLRRINAIVASCWNYFTIKHDARNHKY